MVHPNYTLKNVFLLFVISYFHMIYILEYLSTALSVNVSVIGILNLDRHIAVEFLDAVNTTVH